MNIKDFKSGTLRQEYQYKSFIPNFNDSMAQLNPASSSFVPELYNALSEKDKETLKQDSLTSMPIGVASMSIPFLGMFQDTREGLQEMLGTRHPEILQRAINNYNAKVVLEKNMARQEAESIHDQLLADKLHQDIQETITNNFQQGNAINLGLPTIAKLNQDIPIDLTRGRGFNF